MCSQLSPGSEFTSAVEQLGSISSRLHLPGLETLNQSLLPAQQQRVIHPPAAPLPAASLQ